jgi:hypothetical protein
VAELSVQVPVSLIKRAKDALFEVPPSSRNADIYSDLCALLDPSTIRDVTPPTEGTK